MGRSWVTSIRANFREGHVQPDEEEMRALLEVLKEGKSRRDAQRVASDSRMLSGEGVYEWRKQSGQIDGAIETEAGSFAFTGGRICRSDDHDLQSGSPARTHFQLETTLKDEMLSACDEQTPAQGLDTLAEIWTLLDRTGVFLVEQGRKIWGRVDAQDRQGMLERFPEPFACTLEEHEPESELTPAPKTKATGAGDTSDPWLTTAVKLEATGQSEESLDIIFDKLDDWLLDRCFVECSTFLRDVSVDHLSTSQLVTMLTATVHASRELPYRQSFLDRVKRALLSRGEDADTILCGL